MALNNSNLLSIINNSPRTRAVRALKEWVTDGRLPAGERLPAEIRLAAKLNVSRSTIRLALSDLEKEGIVSSDKRRRTVLAHVKPGKTFLSDAVALITDQPMYFERDQTLQVIHTGTVDAVHRAGYDTLNIHPSRIAGDLIQRLILQRPRGVIIMRHALQTPTGQHLPQALQEGNVPFVVYGDIGSTQENQKSLSFDSVASDHEYGSYELTRWLISQGKRRILRLWYFKIATAEERKEWMRQRDLGYERALKEAGVEPMPPLEIYNLNQSQDTLEEFQFQVRLMAGYLIEFLKSKEPIDAIMAASDNVVPVASAALRLHGFEPNKDIPIVGYDNDWKSLPGSKWEPTPPAATVDKRNLEIGQELMSLLQQRIEGTLSPEGQHRVIKPELIILNKS